MKSRRELMFGAGVIGVGALMAATAAQARTLSASASPSLASVTASSPSDVVTVSVSGGVAPYSYQWVRVSGTSDIEASDPNSPATDFRWVGVFNGPARLSNWVCQVTDSNNETTITGSVHVGYSS